MKIHETVSQRSRGGIDIRSDKGGEYFDIRVAANDEVEYEVVDV